MFLQICFIADSGWKKYKLHEVTGLTFNHRERLTLFLLCEDACSVPAPVMNHKVALGRKKKKNSYTNGSGQFQKFPCILRRMVNLQYSEAPVAERLACAVTPSSQQPNPQLTSILSYQHYDKQAHCLIYKVP